MGRGGGPSPDAADRQGQTRRGVQKPTLLPRDIAATLPRLSATDEQDAKEKTALVKFFALGTDWTWFVMEFDGDDTLFGYVFSGLTPLYDELGYFSLSELEALRYPHTDFPLVERATDFEPVSYAELKVATEQRRLALVGNEPV
jgi:hypothetical protein